MKFKDLLSNNWTKIAVGIFVIVFMFGRCQEVQATEVGLGLGWGLPTTYSEGIVSQEIMLKTDDYRWYLSYSRIGLNDNVVLPRYLPEGVRQLNRVTAGYQVVFRRSKNWEPYMMLGAAYFQTAPTPLISERLTYDLRIGIRYRGIIEVDIDGHNSTADRADRNLGMDLIGLRAIFQFGG